MRTDRTSAIGWLTEPVPAMLSVRLLLMLPARFDAVHTNTPDCFSVVGSRVNLRRKEREVKMYSCSYE